MRYLREKIFAQCTLRENIYTSILHYITNMESFSWPYMAAFRGSYIRSRHTVVCRVLDCYADTGVSQWTIGSGE